MGITEKLPEATEDVLFSTRELLYISLGVGGAAILLAVISLMCVCHQCRIINKLKKSISVESSSLKVATLTKSKNNACKPTKTLKRKKSKDKLKKGFDDPLNVGSNDLPVESSATSFKTLDRHGTMGIRNSTDSVVDGDFSSGHGSAGSSGGYPPPHLPPRQGRLMSSMSPSIQMGNNGHGRYPQPVMYDPHGSAMTSSSDHMTRSNDFCGKPRTFMK